MKKTLLPLAMILAVNGLLLAQPALQMNVIPEIGDVVTFYEADTTNVHQGNAGPNQNWDFSTVQPFPGITGTQYFYVAPSSTPLLYSANFPAANFAIKIDADTAIYSYFDKTSNQFAYLGAQSEAYLQKCPNTDIQLKPLNYNNSFTDDFTNSTDAGTGFVFYGKGSRTFTYDAYGTLKTPAGTFPNAMRIKGVSTQTDSVDFGVGQIINRYEITVYDWVAANQPGVLMAVYYTRIISEYRYPGLDTLFEDTGILKSANYISNFTVGAFDRPDELTGVSLELAGANPAIDELAVRITADESNENLQLMLTNIGGRVVETRALAVAAGENRMVLPVGHLSAGAYLLTLTDGKALKTLNWQKF